MIQSLQSIDRSNYLTKNNYIASFGKNVKSNDDGFNNDQKNKTKHHTKQALLLTLSLLAAQNVWLTNINTQNSPSRMEYYTEANSEINNDDLDFYEFSFNPIENLFNEKEFNIVAHRGYSATAPENTIPAYIEAARMGYGKVEADIAWTKDSVPVLLHDDTINRTARYKNGLQPLLSKKCSDLTYSDLLKYDFGIWKGKKYEGTEIPTFSAFLECCKTYNLQPYIEIKQTSSFDSKKAKILVDSVKEAGMEDSVTWISFNANYLELINEQMPNCRLGYLSKEFSVAKTIKTLQNLKTESNDVFLDIKAKAVNDEMKSRLSEAGFYFEAWGVDTPAQLVNLLTIDCTGITTDLFTNNHIQELFLNINDH